MLKWFLERWKNKYIKIVLVAIIIGLTAVCLGASPSAVSSLLVVIFWLSYIVLTVKKSSFLTKKEKIFVYFCLPILTLIALRAIDNFIEIFTLLIPMATRSEIAVFFWLKVAKKDFLTTATACASLNTIAAIIFYATVDLLKTRIVDKHINKTLEKKSAKRILIKIRTVIQEVKILWCEIGDWKKRLLTKLHHRLANADLWLIFFILALPIPWLYVPSIMVTIIRCRNTRYGLIWIMGIVFGRSLIFVWIVWQGLIRI